MDRSTLLKVGAGIVLVAVYGTVRVMQDRPPAQPSPPASENPANTAPPPAPGGAPKGGAASGAVTQLVKQDLKVGKGAAAKPGDRVTVHYRGTLTNGTKFDASYDRHEPFVFTLGGGEVIKGWDVGVAGMKVGGRRKLTVPSDMAYGPAGRPPTIPPDATLVFEVELLKVN
jgi:hypothetical protein